MNHHPVNRQRLAFLLCLLMLACSPPTQARGAALVPLENVLYDQGEQLRGIAVVDGSVYMLSYSTLLRWQPGDHTVTELEASVPFQINFSDMLSPFLLSDGQSLWRFEPQAGRLQQLVVTGDGYQALTPVQLNWRDFIREGNRLERTFLHQGTLWMIQSARDGGTRLLRCQLKEGAKPVGMKVRNLYALTPRQDGKLLALQHDKLTSLGIYDPAVDQFRSIVQVDTDPQPALSGAALLSLEDDTENFMADGDKVWRITPDGGQALCAILPGINFLNPAGTALWASHERLQNC